jgi:tetratricopeptide (TPR) repeat protein
LADSLVYFAIYPHFAAWSRWLKYNYITHEVSIYKEADPRLFTPEVSCLNKTLAEYESCDWRDSTNVRLLVNNIANSGISNYFTLGFLSKTYLEYYKLPGTALVYAGKLIEKYPDIPAGYFLKGQAFELIQNYEQAVINYLKAAECKINCEYYLALSYEHLAYSYSALKKDKEAVTYAVKALNIHNQYWIPDWYMDNIKKLEIIAGNEPGKKL